MENKLNITKILGYLEGLKSNDKIKNRDLEIVLDFFSKNNEIKKSKINVDLNQLIIELYPNLFEAMKKIGEFRVLEITPYGCLIIMKIENHKLLNFSVGNYLIQYSDTHNKYLIYSSQFIVEDSRKLIKEAGNLKVDKLAFISNCNFSRLMGIDKLEIFKGQISYFEISSSYIDSIDISRFIEYNKKKYNYKKIDDYDEEEAIMKSFENGTSDNFGY